MNTIFIRALGSSNKADGLLEAVKSCSSGHHLSSVYIARISQFSGIPGKPFAYWISQNARDVFIRLPKFESPSRTAKQGIATADDFRFLRAWWEVLPDAKRWLSFAKGGGFSPYYSDLDLVIDWSNDGLQIKEFRGANGKVRSRPQNLEYSRRPGLTWSLRPSKDGSVRALPANCIFSVMGSSAFVDADKPQELLALLAICNSSSFNYLIGLLSSRGGEGSNQTKTYDVGCFSNTPVPDYEEQKDVLCNLALELFRLRRSLAIHDETDHAFFCPAIALPGASMSSFDKANTLQERVDNIALDLYGLEESDLFAPERADKPIFAAVDDDLLDQQVSDADVDGIRAYISWLVGCIFGRWDARCALDLREAPQAANPFAPLPICPPGQLQNINSHPASFEDVPESCPICINWEGIMVLDRGHCLDVEQNIRRAFEAIRPLESAKSLDASLETWCSRLGVESLRDYLGSPSGFFSDHLCCYSKSRRQAPIYWQLYGGSGSCSVWLYYHRFTQDTLYRVLRDFVEPRIQQAEREQFELDSQGALSGDAATRLQEAQTLLQDLRILKGELDLVAPFWNPNLNDGVIINHAILWRITPYAPWQKKFKECWDKLVKGDYDWAHLAFHLWPERVIPKCTNDRSLAIAHGLEERLWQETNNGKWLSRQLSEADLQALIAEYSNPAVQSALERFLAAPPPVAPTRTRASRSTRASSSSTPRRARGSAAVVDAEATRQVLLALTAAPSDGLAKTQIADLIGVEANALTAVIKQLKESGQIDQLGERRGARYVLSEQGRAAVAADAGEEA